MRIGRHMLPLFVSNACDTMDDEAFVRFADITLAALGVIDADGNLNDEYLISPYWGDGADDLHPVLTAELLAALSPEMREQVEAMLDSNGENPFV